MPYDTLSIDDIRQLSALQMAKDPRADQILKTLSPDELTAYKEVSSTDKLGPGLNGNDIGFGVALGAGTAGVAGMLPAGALATAGKAAMPSAENLGTAAKWSALGYGISKLPEALRMPAEMMLIMGGAKGSGRTLRPGAIAAEEEAILGPKQMGHLSDEEAISAMRNQPQKGTRTMPTPIGQRQPAGDPPNLQRGGPATRGRASRQPGTFGVPEVNDGPIDWHNVEKSPGGTGRRPIGDPHTMDEADKRKIMFGGVGEGTRPQLRSPGKFDGINKPDPQLESLLKSTGGSYVNSEFAPKGGSPAEPKAPSRKPTKRRSPK